MGGWVGGWVVYLKGTSLHSCAPSPCHRDQIEPEAWVMPRRPSHILLLSVID